MSVSIFSGAARRSCPGRPPVRDIRRGVRAAAGALTAMALWAAANLAGAAQVDIAGPLGSNAFGTTVAVLDTGNIVVTDPNYAANARGAVYLYSPSGVQISMLFGATNNDHVGSGGIVALGNGKFVVVSPLWSNGTSANAGAVTLVDGTSGLSDTVSTANSLVGSQPGDQVGNGGVIALGNGNFVVASPNWDDGGTADVGAVTWVSGTLGLTGAIFDTNSLIGSKAGDHVGSGGITRLTNANYVVSSPNWSSASVANIGAVTWGSGVAGIAGTIKDINSLLGAKANDHVGNGGVTALTNGNYVAVSINWTNNTHANAGAATWGDGTHGTTGAVGPSNSLVGTSTNDQVGSGGVVALPVNGNYVVTSRLWDRNGTADVGAVSWGDGIHGTFGDVAETNSLVGFTVSDQVGETGVTALANGNYVVASRLWNNGGNANAGAVTWGDGTTGVFGDITNANSLIGGTAGDRVGSGGVTALSNGNYVVSSPLWDSVVVVDVGAVTWGNGSAGSHGTVLAANSLTGSTLSDQIGSNGVTPLTNGSYVVCSSLWDNGGDADVGAVTWEDGGAPVSDIVGTGNSLIGTTPGDTVCSGGAIAVGNGNYVVASPAWNGAVTTAGAVTWGAGVAAFSASVSALNSLIGTTAADQVGSGGVARLGSGDYVAISPLWDNLANADAGAISLGRRNGGSVGELVPANSVLGTVAAAGAGLVFAYDATRDTLVVGQPAANVVSLFRADLLFTAGFAHAVPDL